LQELTLVGFNLAHHERTHPACTEKPWRKRKPRWANITITKLASRNLTQHD